MASEFCRSFVELTSNSSDEVNLCIELLIFVNRPLVVGSFNARILNEPSQLNSMKEFYVIFQIDLELNFFKKLKLSFLEFGSL